MKKYWTIALALVVSACMQAPTPRPFEPLSFTDTPPILFDVAYIRLSEGYEPPQQYPHVGHLFPTPPVEAVRIWANDRLKGVGGQGYLEIIINDASVIEQRLDKTGGLPGVFTDDPDTKFDSAIRVTFRLYDGIHSVSRAETNAFVKRSRSVSENMNAVEREAFMQELMRDMMQQFDQAANRQFRDYFRQYLR